MYSEITSAESQLVSEIFSKRQSLGADLQKVACDSSKAKS